MGAERKIHGAVESGGTDLKGASDPAESLLDTWRGKQLDNYTATYWLHAALQETFRLDSSLKEATVSSTSAVSL